jgi:hypothetical protein
VQLRPSCLQQVQSRISFEEARDKFNSEGSNPPLSHTLTDSLARSSSDAETGSVEDVEWTKPGGCMFPRLLLLLSLLFLLQTSFAQEPGRVGPGPPDSCPVTKASDRPFIPPWPYDAKPHSGGSWFGTDRLWIAPPADGVWRGLGSFTPAGPTFGQKMQWWRQGYDAHTEPKPKLKVTGKRLDAPALPLTAEVSNVSGSKPSMMVGMNFPTRGCWEITGRYEDDELTFVVWLAE